MAMEERDVGDHAREVLAGLTFACVARGACSIRHIVRPAMVSKCLAGLLGYSPSEQEHIRLATAAHDVGKLAVPDALLAKVGALNSQEWGSLHGHAAAGASLFEGSDHFLLQLAGQIAHYHHERYDGAGYPQRLAGPQIPAAARIVAVADVFDALTEWRPYHTVMSDQQAAEIISMGQGTQFDPAVTEVFQRHFDTVISECRAVDTLLAGASHRDILDDFFELHLSADKHPVPWSVAQSGGFAHVRHALR